MATTEMSKYFIVVIDKPFDMTGCIKFDVDEWSNMMNAMYPFYALILHDSDLNEELMPKSEHLHICIYRGKRCRISTMINEIHKWTGYPMNTISVRIPTCWNRSLRYLIHLDDPDKAPYTTLEVKTNNWDEFDNALKQLTDFVDFDTINRICMQYYSMPEIIKALGVDTYNKYWRIVKAITDDWLWKMRSETEQKTRAKKYREKMKDLGVDYV